MNISSLPLSLVCPSCLGRDERHSTRTAQTRRLADSPWSTRSFPRRLAGVEKLWRGYGIRNISGESNYMWRRLLHNFNMVTPL
jgi:hypothetical protein